MSTEKSKQEWAVVTTEWRAIFVGQVESYDAPRRSVIMTNVQNVIYFGGVEGWVRLAAKGPIDDDRLGSVTERMRLEGVTAIAPCSHEAVKAWEGRRR